MHLYSGTPCTVKRWCRCSHADCLCDERVVAPANAPSGIVEGRMVLFCDERFS